jgi:hypothetical protein
MWTQNGRIFDADEPLTMSPALRIIVIRSRGVDHGSTHYQTDERHDGSSESNLKRSIQPDELETVPPVTRKPIVSGGTVKAGTLLKNLDSWMSVDDRKARRDRYLTWHWVPRPREITRSAHMAP